MQYSYRECVEQIGLPENTHVEELENSVVQAFEIAGVNVKKRDFHTIHRLGNSKIAIAKLGTPLKSYEIKRNSVNFLVAENKSLEQIKFMPTGPCVPITNGFLVSAMCYSKRSKLNLSIQLMAR